MKESMKVKLRADLLQFLEEKLIASYEHFVSGFLDEFVSRVELKIYTKRNSKTQKCWIKEVLEEKEMKSE